MLASDPAGRNKMLAPGEHLKFLVRLGAHHPVCGCCFTLRLKYFSAGAGRQGWPARTGRQAMQVPARQLFLFIFCLMLIFMFPFIEELLFYCPKPLPVLFF